MSDGAPESEITDRDNFAILKMLATALRKDPSLTSKLVAAVSGDAPATSTPLSKFSSGPYYREKFALQIKPILDQMMADGRDKIIKYEHHQGIKRKTLWNRIYQSIAYLCTHLDTPDRKYYCFWQTFSVESGDSGIILKLDKNIDLQSPLIASSIDDTSTSDLQSRWRDKLSDFLENADPLDTGCRFIEDNAMLSDAQVIQLQEELSNLKGVIATITNSTIKVIKLPHNQVTTD